MLQCVLSHHVRIYILRVGDIASVRFCATAVAASSSLAATSLASAFIAAASVPSATDVAERDQSEFRLHLSSNQL
jgi:hypothetical protein